MITNIYKKSIHDMKQYKLYFVQFHIMSFEKI